MAFPARPQPAAPTHASAHRIRRKSPLQSCRAIRRSLVHTNLYEQASPQADRGSRCNPASASPNPWRNPHSARGTAATHFPRFRALALFGRRPPERVVRPSSRRPKTCTKAEVELANADFRFTPQSRHPAGGLGCPFCAAKNRHCRLATARWLRLWIRLLWQNDFRRWRSKARLPYRDSS